MLSFNSNKVSLFWDYAVPSDIQYDCDYWYYTSADRDFKNDGHSYRMHTNKVNIEIPRDMITPNNENIIVIHLFGLSEPTDTGKGIGLAVMKEFLKIYGVDHDIYLTVGILSSEDKMLIDEDPKNEIHCINRICNFYKKSGFNELERTIDSSLAYGHKVLMKRSKGISRT